MKYLAENMNIALANDWITSTSGAERVILSISKIFPSAPIYTSVYEKDNAPGFEKKDVRTSFLQNYKLVKRHRELLVPLIYFAFENIDIGDCNLLISSTTGGAKAIITKPETIHVCYCHTPPRYLWYPKLDPRSSQGSFKLLRKWSRKWLKKWDLAAAARPDFYLANSKNVQKRIKDIYGINSTVIYPPVSVEMFRPKKNVKIKEYFLFVSRLVGYKRCDLVIKAFNQLGLPLKIIGSGPEKKRLQKMSSKNIEFLGFVDDKRMIKYYQEAKAFVFAAEEDFGIVPIEAMAAGRPVIAYKAGGAKETVIEGVTGIFFHKQTAESLVEAVKKFKVSDFDSQKIIKHAERFSNQRFEKELTAYLNKILKTGKRIKDNNYI